ncbi:Wzz/FepE/Etk N-terminal domain-containing protein [Lagierella sp.]|uniref:YveK family protein n=1 Tax=Lagierella sp. TaxID=2849657 RepID=UPI00262A5356|nr:Wzz/FepE/Etk N-terminal domain-containing protein [Lagierella sp.]
MEELTLLELFNGLKKRLTMIIAFMVVGGLLAFTVSQFFIQPKYEASSTLIIGKSEGYDDKDQNLQYNQVLLNQKLVSTYSEIIKSRAISDKVIKNLQLDFTREKYQEEVKVVNVKDTELISIIVRDNIPERAMDIANETAEIFQENIKPIMDINNVKILDEAVLPEKPVSPRVKINTILGILLGAFISMLIATFLEIFDTTLKSANEIQKKFNLPILGVIPKIKEK